MINPADFSLSISVQSIDWCCRPSAPTRPASEGWKGRLGRAPVAAVAGEAAVGGGGGTAGTEVGIEVGMEDIEAV